MKNGEQKQKNALAKLVMVMITFIICAGVFYGLRVMFRTFGNTSVEPYDAMFPHSLPEKQVYIAQRDTVLDLTGGELCFSSVKKENPLLLELCSGKHCECIISMEEALQENRYPDVFVFTNADFSAPGRYTVTFYSKQEYMDKNWLISCAYPIVVIDPKDAAR